MMLSEKDIIAINTEFAGGVLVNPSSLHDAYATARKTRSWTRGCAHLVRALLLDHAFENGNKRTALFIIIREAYHNDRYDLNSRKLAAALLRITKRRINNLATIEEVIQDAIE